MTETTRSRPSASIAQAFHALSIDTRGPGLSELTDKVRGWLAEIAAVDGLLTLFIRHTSASLLIQENADPDVHTDLINALERLAPKNQPYIHDVEGPDDMPAHAKSVLVGSSLTIPVSAGRLALGTWQGIYLCEHRDQGGPRRVVVTLWGEP